MICKSLLAGFVAICLLYGYESGDDHRASIRLSDSNFHRYPPRALFTSEGKLLIAYRTSQSKDKSSTLQIAEFDGRTGTQIAKHSYAVPSAGSTKISNGFVMARNGRSLYYVELSGNPVVLEISNSTLGVLSQSTAKLFGVSDFGARVEGITDNTLFISARSRLSGEAVHLVGLDSGDMAKTTFDEQIPNRSGWGQSYRLSFTGDSLWMGSGRYWLKIGIRSGQLEEKLTAQNDVQQLAVSSSGLIGMSNLGTAGYLQFFDKAGRQVNTLEEPGCGFSSIELSPDERYGVAVCETTGTTEWAFGRTLNRKAFVFDCQTPVVIKSFPLSRMSLKSSSGTNDALVWCPQPIIWDSWQHGLIYIPDFSGTLNLQELTLPQHAFFR